MGTKKRTMTPEAEKEVYYCPFHGGPCKREMCMAYTDLEHIGLSSHDYLCTFVDGIAGICQKLERIADMLEGEEED
jgi:hypothetical protein